MARASASYRRGAGLVRWVVGGSQWVACAVLGGASVGLWVGGWLLGSVVGVSAGSARHPPQINFCGKPVRCAVVTFHGGAGGIDASRALPLYARE